MRSGVRDVPNVSYFFNQVMYNTITWNITTEWQNFTNNR